MQWQIIVLHKTIFALEWLWQDYFLYEYYKKKFAERVEAFGRAKINAEKQVLRRTLSNAISQCYKPDDIGSDAIKHFCNYYKKDEIHMLHELQEIQKKKVLDISNISESTAIRR